MAQFNSRFTSHQQDAETPWDLFNAIQAQFALTRDVAATSATAKLPDFWTPEEDCLTREWSGRNWLNPPFLYMQKFVRKAWEERERAMTVLLIPARTNTVWWHQYCMKGEVLFLQGRPKFANKPHGLPTPLALVIFGGDPARQGTMGSFVVPQARKKLG